MLDDLDRRLAGLSAQRARLLGDAGGAPPPTDIAQDTPALPAPPAAESAAAPPSPTATIHARQLAALLRTLERQADRDLLREEQALRADAARQVAAARERLRAETDTAIERAAREDGFAVQALDIRRTVAQEQVKTKLLLIADLQRKDAGADAQAKAARTYADAYPGDKRARERAEKTEAWAKYTARRMDVLQEDARAATARLETITRDLGRARARLRARLNALDAAYQRDVDAAVADSATRLNDTLAALRARAKQTMAQQVTHEADRLAQERLRELPPAPPVRVAFNAVPAGELRLETADLRDAVMHADAAARQGGAAAVQAVDRVIARLTAERAAMAARIAEDTRALAASLAAQRGILLAFDRRAGADMTGDVQRWLGEYWPR